MMKKYIQPLIITHKISPANNVLAATSQTTVREYNKQETTTLGGDEPPSARENIWD